MARKRWPAYIFLLWLESNVFLQSVLGWIKAPLCCVRSHLHEQRLIPKQLYGSIDSQNIVRERQEGGEWAATSLQSDTAEQTLRWCANFVVPLDLCPWAAASISTEGALRVYLSDYNKMKDAVEEAARQLRHDVETSIIDPSVAIAFVVTSDRTLDFPSFFEWFEALEESFEDDFVTLAPFHPQWEFSGGPPEVNVEKHSPYPTVTVVCTSAIDKAGPAATEQIGKHNEEVLLELGISELRRLYQLVVFHEDSPS